ncbi:MAG TPA: hypothetical protein VM101_01345 [Flavitalea sp.]|nr:hypothetical protein [Flavitalea sp.]
MQVAKDVFGKVEEANIGFDAGLVKNITQESDLFYEKFNDILSVRTATIPATCVLLM